MSGYAVKTRKPTIHGLMKSRAARRSLEARRGAVRVITAISGSLVLPLGPRVVERLLCLLLSLRHRILGRLLPVQDAVDAVLPGLRELLTRGVRRHREGVVV